MIKALILLTLVSTLLSTLVPMALSESESFSYTYENITITPDPGTWTHIYKMSSIDRFSIDVYADRTNYTIYIIGYQGSKFVFNTFKTTCPNNCSAVINSSDEWLSNVTGFDRCEVVVSSSDLFAPVEQGALVIYNMTITIDGEPYIPIPGDSLPTPSGSPSDSPTVVIKVPAPVLGTGAIVGIVIGSVVLLALCIAGIILIIKRQTYVRE